MKKIYNIILLILLNISCIDVKSEKFHSQIEANLIIVTRENIVIKKIENKNQIDSIIKRLNRGNSEFIKFASKNKLNFYKNDSLLMEVSYSDKYFKVQGVTYSW